MQNLKLICGIALCFLLQQPLFAQSDFVHKKYIGLETGISSVKVPAAIRILDNSNPDEQPNIRIQDKKFLTPSLGIAVFKARKPNRYISYNLNFNYLKGKNDLYLFRSDYLKEYEKDFRFVNGESPFVRKETFETFTNWETQAQLGLFRGRDFSNKFKLLYGINFGLGIQQLNYKDADPILSAVDVTRTSGVVTVDLQLMLQYAISEKWQVFARTATTLYDIGVSSVTRADRLSSTDFDLTTSLGLDLFRVGILTNLNK